MQLRQRVKGALVRRGIRPPQGAWRSAYRTWRRQVAPTPSPRDHVWGKILGQLEEADTRVDAPPGGDAQLG